LRPRKENKDPVPSSPNKTIEDKSAWRKTLEQDYMDDVINFDAYSDALIAHAHAAGMEEFRKKAIEAVTTVFKEISDLNIDGDEKYWKVEAFGYAPHDMEASKDKFFPKEVKGKLLAALNKLTP
jgi:hypothetical protein